MSLFRRQFTLGQWAKLIVLCALYFTLARISVPGAVNFLTTVVLSSSHHRAKESPAGVDGVVLRFLTLVGCGTAYYAYFYFLPHPAATGGVVLFSFYSLIFVGSLWEYVVSRPGYPSCGPIVRIRLGDDVSRPAHPSCGPIVRIRLGDDRKSKTPSDASGGFGMGADDV